MDPEIPQESRSIPRLIVSVVLGLLVLVAVILVGLRLVRERMAKPSDKTTVASLSPSPTPQALGGGFPTVSSGQPTPTTMQSQTQFQAQTGQTKGGQPPVLGQGQAYILPASGPEVVGLIILAGTGLAGTLLRRRKF